MTTVIYIGTMSQQHISGLHSSHHTYHIASNTTAEEAPGAATVNNLIGGPTMGQYFLFFAYSVAINPSHLILNQMTNLYKYNL